MLGPSCIRVFEAKMNKSLYRLYYRILKEGRRVINGESVNNNYEILIQSIGWEMTSYIILGPNGQ